jgi:hypothetical protein
MSEEQIIWFLDQYLGVRLPLGTPRTVLLSKLDSVSVAARDI